MATAVKDATDVLVFPYVEDAGVFPDEFLVAIWKRSKDEGMLPWIFPGQGDLSLPAFIQMVRKRWMLVASSRSLNTFLGYGWLFEVEGEPNYRKASLGFGFFKQFRGSEMIRQAARLAISWWFENVQLQVLFGATRSGNLPAIKFSRELGFQQIGVAPRFFSGPAGTYDAHLVCVTREDWEEHNRRPEPEHATI